MILYAILFACILAGGGLVWHSIGESAVEKHLQEQRVEQDKQDAVAKVKQEEASNRLVALQTAYQEGLAQVKEREVVRYQKVKEIVKGDPVFLNKDCVVPKEGMAILNGARGELQNSTVADIFGFTKPLENPVTIRPPAKPAESPAPAPAPASRTVTNPLLKAKP